MSHSFKFQLIGALGAEPFHQSRTEDLCELLKVRLPGLKNFGYEGRISDEDMRRSHGFVAGVEPPPLNLLDVGLSDDLSREQVRKHVQDALADLGISDLTVTNA